MFRQVTRGRLYEQVAEQIQELIITKKLQPGDGLPPERELGEHFGVSRTVVREATKVLAQRGLLKIEPGRGALVRPLTPSSATEFIRLFYEMQSNNIHDLQEVRESLEIPIAGLAAERATEREIEEMERAVKEMDENIQSPEGYIEADLAFHLALAKATQNLMFLVLLNPIIDLLRESRHIIFQVPGAPNRGQYYHREILDCVRKGKKEAAEEAMRQHLLQVAEDVAVGERQLCASNNSL